MTTEEMIAVMQAYARGERIQSRAIASTEWWEAPNPGWNWGPVEYRIKPREPREFWIMPNGNDGDYRMQMINTAKFKSPHGEVIHVREVIE